VADRTGSGTRDARRALTALDEVLLDELRNAQKVRIGGLVQLTVRVKPARKAPNARTGRNPATGDQITIAAQSASRRRACSTAGASERRAAALPAVQKAAAGSPPEPNRLTSTREDHHGRQSRKTSQ
jgi:nucleoid DNA-binding protein